MWMKVDDRLHSHRKTRTVSRSHDTKGRDVAPMGLWICAGSWAAQNGTEGWIPEDELDRWDDDWESLSGRLVDGGYWWREERDGDPGFGFHDWHDYNDPADLASKSGTFGNHVRWHVNKGLVEPECDHCPTIPDDPESVPDIAPESGGDRGAMSGGESGQASPPIALPVSRPDPIPEPGPTPRAVDRPPIATSTRALAIVSSDITPSTLIAEWIDHCEQRPPQRVVGQVSKELKSLLDEGIDPERVRHALAEWNRKGLHPSTLASVVHEVANRKPQQRRGDIDWDAAFARAEAKTQAAIEGGTA